MALKQQTDFSSFLALDIRLGKIIKVEESLAKKPTYKITVDFGSEIGQKVTIGAYKHYAPDQLNGLLVLGIMNVGTRKMGPEISEFLLLGIPNDSGEAIPLTVFRPDAQIGGEVF